MNWDSLINTILNRYSRTGDWNITTTELIQLLGINTAAFYRILYSLKDKLHYPEALDGFCRDTTGELITLLEALSKDDGYTAYPDVEQAFCRAGLFLPYKLRLELTEFFIDSINRIIKRHNIDFEEAEDMLRHKKGLRQVCELYLSVHFDFITILTETAEAFQKQINTHTCLKQTSIHYLEDIFKRHLLDWEKLFYPVFAELENHFKNDTVTEEPVTEPLAEARSLFALKGNNCEPVLLKKRYKELMKMFHPDINPAGLEKAKKINIAYALLLSELN